MMRTLLLLSVLIVAGCGLWSDKSEERRRSSDLYVRKGVAYLEAGRYENARADLEKALDLSSRNSEAHNALGVLFERLDKQDEARFHFKKAVGLDENNYGALNNYSRFLCSHGSYEEGIESLQQVIASKVYSQPWLALTNQAFATSRPEKSTRRSGLCAAPWKAAPTSLPRCWKWRASLSTRKTT